VSWFDAVFEGCGVRILRSAPRAPRAARTCSDPERNAPGRRRGRVRRPLQRRTSAPGHRPACARRRPGPADRHCHRPGDRAHPPKTGSRWPHQRVSGSCIASLLQARHRNRIFEYDKLAGRCERRADRLGDGALAVNGLTGTTNRAITHGHPRPPSSFAAARLRAKSGALRPPPDPKPSPLPATSLGTTPPHAVTPADPRSATPRHEDTVRAVIV
jgi:hypothetical protein